MNLYLYIYEIGSDNISTIVEFPLHIRNGYKWHELKGASEKGNQGQ
jgi:hypothetical protein